MISWEISKLSQLAIFRNIFICVKESNYMNDYLKVRRKAKGNEKFLPFSHNINHLLEWNHRKRRAHLAHQI